MLILVFQALMPWPRRSVAGLTTEARLQSQVSPLRFVVGTVTLGQVLLPELRFPLSASFQQRCSLIFVCMLLLPEGQTGESWKPSTKQCSFVNLRAADRKVFFFALFILYSLLLLKCELVR
jgi:hypothetical protein